MENKTISWLKKKYDLLTELLRVTKLINLTTVQSSLENEANDYIFLIEKRAQIFEAINKINNKLSYTQDSVDSQKQATELNSNINSLIRQIIDIDKENNSKARCIFENLGNMIKDIKTSRDINIAYNNIPKTEGIGARYDYSG